MEKNKRTSIFESLGMPIEITSPLTLAAIAISVWPLLGGIDFGPIKLPDFNGENKEKHIMVWSTISFFLILGHVHVLQRKENSKEIGNTSIVKKEWKSKIGKRVSVYNMIDDISNIVGTEEKNSIYFDVMDKSGKIESGVRLSSSATSVNGTMFTFNKNGKLLHLSDRQIEWITVSEVR